MRLVAIQALEDLKEIGAWIQKDNPRRARAFVQELRLRCSGLVGYPARFPIIAEREGACVRRCVHRDYLILFDADTEPNAVIILRVLHGARDYERLLGETGPDDQEHSQ